MASEIRWPLLILVLIFFTDLIGLLEAYQFNVGGREGWVLNPSENWAERMRLKVNDTLFFKYTKGSDPVLVVSKEDYDNCNTQKPILKMGGGDSVFKLDPSGPFYFITGNKRNCQNSHKLIIVVLAVRNKPTSPTPSPRLQRCRLHQQRQLCCLVSISVNFVSSSTCRWCSRAHQCATTALWMVN